jgi:hypothetical protein
MGAKKSYKRHILYNGKLYTLSEMVEGRELNTETLRSRLVRNAEQVFVNGLMCFVCEDFFLRPQLKPGKRQSQRKEWEDMPFRITRYCYNVDGGENVLRLNKISQQWLSKSIRKSA